MWGEDLDFDELMPGWTERGYDAAIGIARVRVDGERRRAFFGVIAGEGRTVYRFLYLTRRANRRERRQFEAVLDSFARLTPAEAARLRPLRIVVHRVEPADTVDRLVTRMQVERLPREHFLVLNALREGVPLQPGLRVKLVRRR